VAHRISNNAALVLPVMPPSGLKEGILGGFEARSVAVIGRVYNGLIGNRSDAPMVLNHNNAVS